MRLLFGMFLICASLMLYGCGFFGGERMSGELTAEVRPIGPVTDPTFEERVQNTEQFLAAAQDSFQKMNELAGEENAPKKGIKAAGKVNKKYEKRLSELSETDFSGLTEDELYDVSEEIADMISAAREARDLLQGL